MVLAPPFSGLRRAAIAPVHETIKLISIGMLPAEIRRLLGFSWDPAREALLRSALLQLRLGSRFWPDPVRLPPGRPRRGRRALRRPRRLSRSTRRPHHSRPPARRLPARAPG